MDNNTAVIGLGSNIEPDKNIADVRKILRDRYKVLNESEFIVTKPFGYEDQANFINGAVLIQTDTPQEILARELKQIETEMGRKKADFKFGPRTIDLDIIVFNDKIVDQDFYERDYLKTSVLQLLPDLKY
ncbi:MAG: 2-amino-4-hydroxy-6-hydroxymethyldihydropteridine diphosphokinase [Candidatus Omnitrophica bacterium]|nr:2-amino-4-hydroxy-6-hydroxymethyldihydropteridine diphosphokinase [Candidatus Omnitrophota bacterium]